MPRANSRPRTVTRTVRAWAICCAGGQIHVVRYDYADVRSTLRSLDDVPRCTGWSCPEYCVHPHTVIPLVGTVKVKGGKR